MKDIILEGSSMEKKVAGLTKVKVDSEFYRTFYIDDQTGEKWVYEHLFTGVQEIPPQLRLLDKFPWE